MKINVHDVMLYALILSHYILYFNLQLLEQALVIEEQLRKAVEMDGSLTTDTKVDRYGDITLYIMCNKELTISFYLILVANAVSKPVPIIGFV